MRRRVGRTDKPPIALKDLFSKYRQILRAPQGTVIKSFVEVVSNDYALPLKAEHVSYTVRDRILFLTCPGVLKQEILLHKSAILQRLTAVFSEHSAPKDIR